MKKNNDSKDVLSCKADLMGVDEKGNFEGYASIFGNIDRGNDVVEKGAFTQSLTKKDAKAIKMLWQHDPSEPIGVFTEMHEDEKGLYVKGCLLLEVSKGREVYEMMKSGAIDAMSIGFHTIDSEVRSDGVRYLKEIDLWEISIVTFPMNEDARISGIKGNIPPIREIEKSLMRDAGLSAVHAKAILAGGYKAAYGTRDAAVDGETLGNIKQLTTLIESL